MGCTFIFPKSSPFQPYAMYKGCHPTLSNQSWECPGIVMERAQAITTTSGHTSL